VRYLNSVPLIDGLAGVSLEHPAVLADRLHAGELDVALVPVFELLSGMVNGVDYRFVDGYGVGCDGEVYSVFMAYRGSLEGVRRVRLDPASRSSVNLLKVLARMGGWKWEYVADLGDGEREGDARLLIGNQAIEFRLGAGERDGWEIADLGEWWKRETGLPFVYAVWGIRPGVRDAERIADVLREVATGGVSRLPELAREYGGEFGEDVARRYLTSFIRFRCDAAAKAGMRRYAEELAQAGLLAGVPGKFEWV
jgi:predicted solute-binding protein